MIATKDLHLIEITNKAWSKVLMANAERFYEVKRAWINSIYVIANFFNRNAKKRAIDGFKPQ